MTLVDASAVLAWLQAEPGAAAVDTALDDPERAARVLATNWAEVLTVARRRGQHVDHVDALLRAAGFLPVPVVDDDARLSAAYWEPWLGLSLADRLCLAASARLAPAPARVLTADADWECAINLGGAEVVHIRALPLRDGAGFAAWLSRQLHRDDPVGDLARDSSHDATWPTDGPISLAELLAHLERRGAGEARTTMVRRAWREWTRTLG